MMPVRRLAWLTSTLLGLAILALAWQLGHGAAGLAYAGAYLLATLPGWPLGWRLFGHRHAGGWIAGVPKPAAFALSVLFVALGVVGNLPGGVLWTRSGLTPPQEPPQDAAQDPARGPA